MSESKSKRRSAGGILAALFALAVFLSALTKIEDTEAWLHLSLGRLIWETGGVPKIEMFTYPTYGEPFSYNSWLFGLLTYVLNAQFGAYGLGLLQASVIALAFYILFRDSLRPYKNHLVAAMVLLAVAYYSQYRFVLRPDMFLMVFLSFSIFSLNALLYEDKKYLYALPFIHLLWANMHASVIVMSVPFLAFIGGSLLHGYLGRRGIGPREAFTRPQMKAVIIVFALSLAATLITPFFSLHQYIYGPKYLTSAWHTHRIIEMLPPSGWDRTLLYIIIGATAASFALNGKRMSFICLILVVPFMALSFASVRFGFILAITAGPVFVRNVSAFIEDRGWSALINTKTAVALSALCIALYGSFNVNQAVGIGQFGFGFDYAEMPKGAVEYMDRKNIYGKIYNTFHFGQYITWTGYPKREVFMDARGHLPEELLIRAQDAIFSREEMDALSGQYDFEVALIERPRIPPRTKKAHMGVDMTFDMPGWALVYWDDNSFLYLKRGGKYSSLIEADEYRFIKPLKPFSTFIRGLSAENMAGFESDLKRNIAETNSPTAYMFLSLLYLTKGDYGAAVEAASGVRSEGFKGRQYIVKGDAYKELGNLEASLNSYEEALRRDEVPVVFYRAGVVSSMMGDNRRALKYFARAIELDPAMISAYPKLIDAYTALGMEKEAREAMRKYQGMSGEGR